LWFVVIDIITIIIVNGGGLVCEWGLGW
jgi:hypothetical protein